MDFVANFAGILLGGLSAGTVLFIVSVGLSVTMGLMGFVNLAHGAFAMVGGYVIVRAMNGLGLGFTEALALGFALHRIRESISIHFFGAHGPSASTLH